MSRLTSAVMEALMWDCDHDGEWVNGECADCARLRDAILAAAEPVLRQATGHIPPGTPPPKITAEVWECESQYAARVVDVVRINDTWHVVAVLDD